MSKKVRGSARTHHRPGTRPATDRASTPRRARVVEPPSLAEAEVVAQDVIEDRPPAAPAQEAGTRSHPRHRVKAGSLLAARAATEYVYVAKDMRRILLVAGLLITVMLVLWLLLVVMRVVPLPFY